MVVIFMCQLNWARMPRWLVKHYLWMCLWGCAWKRLIFEVLNWVKQVALPNVDGQYPFSWGLKRAKSRARATVSLCLSWDAISCSWTSHQSSDSLDFRLRAGLLPSANSQAFRLGMNYTPGSPGLQFGNNRLWDFSGLHNRRSQFL